jgi:hypothetical protein
VVVGTVAQHAPLSAAGGDAGGGDARRSTLPHADLELELQIRHNMLIEQQHRIAQLEEELSRSRAEVCAPPPVVPFLSFPLALFRSSFPAFPFFFIFI